MKIIYNRLIPFKGFMAINLFGIMFVRKEYEGKVGKNTINHEAIHTAQQKELLYIGFYLWYFIEWLIRLVFDTRNAYRNISFEKEAYQNQHKPNYLQTRQKYCWIKLIKNKK